MFTIRQMAKELKVSEKLIRIYHKQFIEFLTNKKTKGKTAKKPTKNLTELKVNGPILSIPVS